MPTRKDTVLVVDDDVRMLRLIQHILELEGYQIVRASNGKDALSLLEEKTPNLLLLDIMMPGMDGYTLCKQVREFSQVPIIMVTAKNDENETVRCLEAGADDYITKPFSSKELVARVKAVVRRTALWDEKPEPVFIAGDLVIDFARHIVTIDDVEVTLTATEYKLLSYLARSADRVVTPNQILEMVWGKDYLGETHLLQVNMARLRQKLGEKTKSPRHIITKPGIGYVMVKSNCIQE